MTAVGNVDETLAVPVLLYLLCNTYHFNNFSWFRIKLCKAISSPPYIIHKTDLLFSVIKINSSLILRKDEHTRTALRQTQQILLEEPG